jgi:hypothetical protein
MVFQGDGFPGEGVFSGVFPAVRACGKIVEHSSYSAKLPKTDHSVG